MGGFNPQSSGMNRVRAHRRYQPNLQVTTLTAKNGGHREGARLHALPSNPDQERPLAPHPGVQPEAGRNPRPAGR